MNNEYDQQERREDIILYAVMGITIIAAIYISIKFNIRGRTVLYLLVGVEFVVYKFIRWIFKK